jgi:hypothetical protein
MITAIAGRTPRHFGTPRLLSKTARVAPILTSPYPTRMASVPAVFLAGQ